MKGDHDEAQLLKALVRKDPQAQRQMVDRHAPGMLRILENRFHLRRADAEDIVFDVLAEFLSEPAQFDATRGARLNTWLLSVASNRAIDLLRKRGRMQETGLSPNTLRSRNSGTYSESWTALARLVESICKELPEEQQQILWWYAYGISHSTIAAWSGRSNDAVRQAVVRMKRYVAAQLAARVADLPDEQRRVVEARLASGG